MECELFVLLNQPSSRRMAERGASLILEKPELVSTAINYCFEQPYPISMRAAWVLSIVCERDIDLITPHINRILPQIFESKVDGVKRGFLKILCDFYDIALIENSGFLLNKCLDTFINRREAIAVRAMSLKIAYKISLLEPEIQQELKAILTLEPEQESGGMQSVVRNILKKLNKTKKR